MEKQLSQELITLHIKNIHPRPTVVLTGTIEEEIGLRGAMTANSNKSVYMIMLFLFLFSCVIISVKGESEWKDISNSGYKYKNEYFLCKIEKTGILKNLKVKNVNIFESIQIFGIYLSKEGKKIRVFQGDDTPDIICKLKEKKNSVIAVAQGTLVSETKEKIGTFKEKVLFSADKIVLSYEVTTIKDLQMRSWMPFCTLIGGKISNFFNCALYATGKNNKLGIYGIPVRYSEEKECWPRVLRQLKFVFENPTNCISIKNNSNDKLFICVSDGRAWNGKSIEILVKPEFPIKNIYHAVNLLVPKGTKFKWSFSLIYSNY